MAQSVTRRWMGSRAGRHHQNGTPVPKVNYVPWSSTKNINDLSLACGGMPIIPEQQPIGVIIQLALPDAIMTAPYQWSVNR